MIGNTNVVTHPNQTINHQTRSDKMGESHNHHCTCTTVVPRKNDNSMRSHQDPDLCVSEMG